MIYGDVKCFAVKKNRAMEHVSPLIRLGGYEKESHP